ncbi:MAG: cbb3-type cytochrome oxidase assembly protein CcoS [Verrucomicrobia bacterium]|nr:MAG: cbb3-type cytochrome oxidase assembly protein CcoS [Verrucomicrobiota bacterium]
MSVILILILASLVMATVFLFGFIWSVRTGQYEDTTTPSMRVLMEESSAINSARDKVQSLSLTPTLSRWEREQPANASDSLEARPAISDSRNLPTRESVLPLPAGEGRGEGERNAKQQRHFMSEHDPSTK